MFYSVRDAETHEIIIDYTDFSRISNSKDGHFFILDLSGLHVGRYYKIMLMIKSENGTEVFDDTRVFEIGKLIMKNYQSISRMRNSIKEIFKHC